MKILISDLCLQAIIGEYEHERYAKQDLILNIELTTNVQIQDVREDLSQTLDYDALTQRISRFVEKSRFRLLETLASELSQLLLAESRVLAFELEIVKPDALKRAVVSIRVSGEQC